jgi:hypothetical protein
MKTMSAPVQALIKLPSLQIVTMNSSPERKGVASDEDVEAQLRLQYAGLHSNERYPDDQSFSRLLQESSGLSD